MGDVKLSTLVLTQSGSRTTGNLIHPATRESHYAAQHGEIALPAASLLMESPARIRNRVLTPMNGDRVMTDGFDPVDGRR